MVARRTAALSSSFDTGLSARKSSARWSSTLATLSMMSCRSCLASSARSAGIASSRMFLAVVPSTVEGFAQNRSTMPWKRSSAPMGICIITALWRASL